MALARHGSGRFVGVGVGATALMLSVLAAAGSGCTNAEKFRDPGNTALRVGDYATAAEQYRLALEVDPGDHETRNKLGLALMKLNLPLEASREFSLVAGQHPRRADYWDNYADALVAAGRRDEVIRVMTARAQEQRSAVDWTRLGRAADKVGDADLARQALSIAVRLDGGTTTGPYVAFYDFLMARGEKFEALQKLRNAYWINAYDSGVLKRINDGGIATPRGFALQPEGRKQGE